MIPTRKLLLILATTALLTTTASADTVYVNSKDGLKLRAKPDTGSAVIQVLDFGAEIAVTDKTGEWLKVEGGGYVQDTYTQATNPFDSMTCMGEWRITAYAETGYVCANGNYPTTGYTIACNSLPFGTEVYIDGVGFRVVEDRGPGWLGDAWLDIYLGVYDECVQWGNQYRTVWVVNE